MLLEAVWVPSRHPFCQRHVFDPKDTQYCGMQTVTPVLTAMVPKFPLPLHLPDEQDFAPMGAIK